MTDDEKLNLQNKEKLVLNMNGEEIVPYTVASAVEMENGLTVEEHLEELEERFQAVLDDTSDASSKHNHDSLYYRKSEVNTMHTAIEDRIASINVSDHEHEQYAEKKDVYTKVELDNAFGGSFNNVVIKSDLEDYSKKEDLDNYVTIESSSNFATKEEMDKKSDEDHTHDTIYYTRTFLDNVINNLNQKDNEIQDIMVQGLDSKAELKHIHSQYAESDKVYDKEYIDGLETIHNDDIKDALRRIQENKTAIDSIRINVDSTVTEERLGELMSDVETMLNDKANTAHTHTTDDILYKVSENLSENLTETISNIYDEFDNLMEDIDLKYSLADHNHDGRYYTEAEVDDKFFDANKNIEEIYATKQNLLEGLNNKSDFNHTHTDIIETMESIDSDLQSHKESTADDLHAQYALRKVTYTKDEVDVLIAGLDDSVSGTFVTKDLLADELAKKSDTDHTHDDLVENIDNISTTLTTHTHDNIYYTEDEIDTKLTEITDSIETVSTNLSTNYYTKTDADGFLNSKSDKDHTHEDLIENIDNISTTLTTHTHDGRYYTEDEIDTKLTEIINTANLDRSNTEEALATKSHKDHTHDDITTQLNEHTHDGRYYLQSETMTKTEIEDYVVNAVSTGAIDLSSYATKTELSTKSDIGHTHDDITSKITGVEEVLETHKKNGHSDLYYTKSDVYNRNELDVKLELAAIDGTIDMRDYAKLTDIGDKADADHIHADINAEILNLQNFVNTHTHSNFYTKDELYKKSEIHDLIDNIDISDKEVNVDLSDYAKHSDLETKLDSVEFESYKTVIENSITNHNHDGRYYTTAQTLSTNEIDAEIDRKINSNNSNYYNKVSVDSLLENKSNIEHEHDSVYSKLNHTHDEFTTLDELSSIVASNKENTDDAIESINNALKNKYDISELDILLSDKSDVDHTHDDITKALSTHTHDNLYYSKSEIDDKFLHIDGENVDIDLGGYTTRVDFEAFVAQSEIDHSNLENLIENFKQKDVYTKDEANSAINLAISELDIESYAKNDFVLEKLKEKSDTGHLHDNVYVDLTTFEAHKHNNDYYIKSETMSKEEINALLAVEIEKIDFVDDNELALAIKGHNHDEVYVKLADASNHTHEEYLTSGEIDTKIKNEIDTLDSTLSVEIEELDTALSTHNHDKTYVKLADASNHTHDTIEDSISLINTTLATHKHDDRYYTEGEINELLASKADVLTLDSKADKNHTHDEFTTITASIDTLASDLELHNHDKIYAKVDQSYTKAESDNLLGEINLTLESIGETLELKANTSVLEDYSKTDHTHDTEYVRLEDSNNHEHTQYALNTNVYDIETVDGKLEIINDSVSALEEGKANKSDLSNYLPKEDAYTKNDIDGFMEEVSTSVTTIENTLNTKVNSSDLAGLLENKSNVDHDHEGLYSKSGHRHDDDYYTEAEVDGKLSVINDAIESKADTTTVETLTTLVNAKSDLTHTHDNLYVDLLTFEGHKHDDRYYTKAETDTQIINKVNQLQLDVDAIEVNLDIYATKESVNVLLEDKAHVDHKHDEEYAPYTHTHNEYVTNSALTNLNYVDEESLINTLDNYSTTDHTHEQYALGKDVYDKGHIDTELSEISDNITTIINDLDDKASLAYVNEKLLTKSDEGHTHSEYAQKTDVYTIEDIDGKVKIINDTLDEKADTSLVNMFLATKSDIGHSHDDDYVKIDTFETHNHNNDYYKKVDIDAIVTKVEDSIGELSDNVDIELGKKADKNDLDNYSLTSHKHDDDYSNINHLHDDRYAISVNTYNKEQVDTKFDESAGDVDTKLLNYVKVADYNTAMAKKSDVNHLHDEYVPYSVYDEHKHNQYAIKEDVYTKVETDDVVDTAITNLGMENYVNKNLLSDTLKGYSPLVHEHEQYSLDGHTHSQYATTDSVYNKNEVDTKVEVLEGNIELVDSKFANYTTTNNLNTLLLGKSDTDHTHDIYSDINHNHDKTYLKLDVGATKEELETAIQDLNISSYATISSVEKALEKKANVEHEHDANYAPIVHNHNNDYYKKDQTYTREEVTNAISDTSTELDTKISNLAGVVSNKSDKDHKHDEDYANIDHLHDIYALASTVYTKQETEKSITDKLVDYVLATTYESGIASKADKKHSHDEYALKTESYTSADVDSLILSTKTEFTNTLKNYVKTEDFNTRVDNIDLSLIELQGTVASNKASFDTFKKLVEDTYATDEDVSNAVFSIESNLTVVRQSISSLQTEVRTKYTLLEDFNTHVLSVTNHIASSERDISYLRETLSGFMNEADERYVLNDEIYKTFYTNTNTNITNLQTNLNKHITDSTETLSSFSDDLLKMRVDLNSFNTTLDKFDKSFTEFVTVTAPDTYLEIMAFNSYKASIDGRMTTVETKFNELSSNVETFITNTDTKVTALSSNLSNLQTAFTVFSTTTVPETYTRIDTFETFEGNTNASLSRLDGAIKTLDTTLGGRLDTVEGDVTALTSKVTQVETSLGKRIDNVNNDLQDYKSYVETSYTTIASFESYKTSIGSRITGLEGDLDEFKTHVSTNYVSNATLDATKSALNTSINNVASNLTEHEEYAARTYAEKSYVDSNLAKKSDITWVEEKLDEKSDTSHLHDDKYLPITDAIMKGQPKAPTPEDNDSSDRVATTSYVTSVVGTAKRELDEAKLGKKENAVSASKLKDAHSIIISGSARGEATFDGTEDAEISLVLTGNAPTASRWETTRTLSITGDLDGSVDIDGGSNIELELTYSKSSVAPSAEKLSRPMTLYLTDGATGEVTFDGSQDVSMKVELTGNAPTASKLLTPVKINNVEFDGSHNVTIADDTKLPLAGGEMEGSIIMANSLPIQSRDSGNTTRDMLKLDSSNNLILGYSGLPQNSAYLYSGNSIYAIRHAGFDNYDISGNAGTASKLKTSRVVSVTGAMTTNAVDFDGSEDLNLVVTSINLEAETLTGELPVTKGGTGNSWGEAPSATKLHVPVYINECEFDGTANIKMGTLEPIKVPANGLYGNGDKDLNNYKTPGMYYCDASSITSTLKNCPTSAPFALLVEKHNGFHQTLTENMTGNHKIYERNYSGGAWGAWYEAYTSANEPSKTADQVKNPITIKQYDGSKLTSSVTYNGSSEIEVNISTDTIKALSLNGGNMLGDTTFNNGTSVKFKNTGGTSFSALNMGANNMLNVGDVNIRTNIFSSSNPIVTINGDSHSIYHEGNRPAPKDIGAVASSGDTMTGNLTMSNNTFINFPTANKKFNLNNSSAASIIPGYTGLSSTDADIRVATPHSFGITPTTPGGVVSVGNNGIWFDAKNGNIYAVGNIYENVNNGGTTGSSLKEKYMGIEKVDNYYGMVANGDKDNYIRTTTKGLIPSSSSSNSTLGTSSWNFGEAHIKEIFENSQSLSKRYISLNENTQFETTKAISLNNRTVNLTLDRMQKCTNSFTANNSYTIKLPDVNNLSCPNGKIDTITIHVLFTAMSGGTLSFTNASGLKWYATPQIISGKMHEFIFTYYNGTWVGGVIHYG